MAERVHVVGAGLAGLAAAVELAAAGRDVTLYEAAPQAGGRCRSYLDGELGCRIDNGNHLLLGANSAALGYLRRIGAEATLTGPEAPRFPFFDLATGEFWVLTPGMGRLPWWLLDRRRRVPGTRPLDYLSAMRLGWARPEDTVTQRLDTASPLFRRLLGPLAVAALNTAPDEASATLLWRIVKETFGAGGGALRPLVPREGLTESFVDPALGFLRRARADTRFGWRLRGFAMGEDRVEALEFDAGRVNVGGGEAIVLAVPAPVATRLLPGLAAPTEFRAIVNAHYRVSLGGDLPLVMGLIGGTAEWLFRKSEVVSVTVSAADRLVDTPAEALADLLWREATRAYRLPGGGALPSWRIVKEKRATFAATPAQERLRPGSATKWRNLFLAGDWTATGLPATIEGAIRSGHRAARLAIVGAATPIATKALSRAQSHRMLTARERN